MFEAISLGNYLTALLQFT